MSLLSNSNAAIPGKPGGLLGERPLNWIALGLLLAAWNAADDDARAVGKPPALRAHSFVSVRALTRASASALPR